jgi:hypothetical protein
MQNFWDISPKFSAQNPPPHWGVPDSCATTLPPATYLLTETVATDFPSAATREAILRWASEEHAAGRYIGQTRVIDLRHVPHTIRRDHLAPHLLGKVQRVLLKTQSELRGGPAIITADAVKLLAGCGVKLLGIDQEALDAPASQSREAFKTAQQSGLCVLLNLELTEVKAGEYDLLAVPTGSGRAGSWQELERAYAKASTTRAA